MRVAVLGGVTVWERGTEGLEEGLGEMARKCIEVSTCTGQPSMEVHRGESSRTPLASHWTAPFYFLIIHLTQK